MIRPVEMQMILPQVNQVGMQQHTADQHASIQSAQGTNELTKTVEQNAETVIPKEDPSLMEFGYDAREKGKNSYDDFFAKRRKKRHEKETAEAEERDRKAKDEKWVNFNIQV